MPRRKLMNTCNSKLLISNKICQTITQRRISEPNCPVIWIVVFDILKLLHATSQGTIRVQPSAGTIRVQADAGLIRVQLLGSVRVQTSMGTIWAQTTQPHNLGTDWWVWAQTRGINVVYKENSCSEILFEVCVALYSSIGCNFLCPGFLFWSRIMRML